MARVEQVRRTRHFIFVREPVCLRAAQQGEDGRERDLGDPSILRSAGMTSQRRWWPAYTVICFSQVDLAVLLHPRSRGDDLRVRALPVVHALLTGLVGPHP